MSLSTTNGHRPLAAWVSQVAGSVDMWGRSMVLTPDAADAEALGQALTREGYTVLRGNTVLEVSDDLSLRNRLCA